MANQRRSADQIHGYSQREQAERHCDESYLIDQSLCPNGCGDMQIEIDVRDGIRSTLQNCGACGFTTNIVPGRHEKALAERIAPGDWRVRDPEAGTWLIESSPDEGETVFENAEIPRPNFGATGDERQLAHAELLLDAVRAVQQTGLSPSELARLATLLARTQDGWHGLEPGSLRAIFDSVLKRTAKARK